MSVATEFAPAVFIPSRARPASSQCERPSAAVSTLHRPSEQSVAVPLRLTRRGLLAIAVAVGVLALGLVWLARFSAPGAQAATPRPDAVTVRTGDTLWAIATRIAPQRDPRAEVADLQRINHLSGVELTAGQLLRTR
ncbi:MAG: peptidoglycan-binding protein [Pseudonocardiales bacterium]|nr:peptidoglycan-binding protein [Pseudonocardiales bacterium]